MPRKARMLSASGVYHIMWRGIDKMQLFADDSDCINFLHLLDFYEKEDFQILAYCLMGNHAHLLVNTSHENAEALERVMKGIGIRYANYYNKRYDRIGPLFQGRYKSQPVESTHYFLRVLRYIHANPVVAGIAPTMDSYQWSSYQDYFGNRKSFCNVNIKYALQLHDLDWLRTWHTQTEINITGLLDDNATASLTDAQARVLIHSLAGMECNEIPLYPDDTVRPLLRRLVVEEGMHLAQISRLTGIARGEIRRCLL